MADGIYVGMAAAAARTAQLESVADNLANAQSPGFKAARPAFQSFMPASGRTDKVMSAAVATGIDLRPGVMVPTDRPLDVVPEGDTFLSVQTPQGTTAYTRNGNIDLGPNGELTIANNLVLDTEGKPIVVPPGSQPKISALGDVTVNDEPIARLGLASISGPLSRSGPALLTPDAGATVTQLEEGLVRPGYLEMGNAPALESTLAMISAQRHFDAAMQAIQTYRSIDQRAVEVGRVR